MRNIYPCAYKVNLEKGLEMHKLSYGYKNDAENKCSICDLNFCTGASLLSHFKNTHDHGIKCNGCGITFENYGLLNDHKSKMHSSGQMNF